MALCSPRNTPGFPGRAADTLCLGPTSYAYTRAIDRIALRHSARRLRDLRAGDCDAMTILLAAMRKARRWVALTGAGQAP